MAAISIYLTFEAELEMIMLSIRMGNRRLSLAQRMAPIVLEIFAMLVF